MVANSSLAYSTAFAILISASRMVSAITGVCSLGVDDRTDFLTRHHADDCAVGIEAEEDHRQFVIASHADRGGIGNLEVLCEVLVVGELVELDRVRVFAGISRIDAVDALLAHQQHLSADFECSLCRYGVSGEVRHTRAGAENDHAALLKMPLGAARDVGLGHLSHRDRGLDAGLNADLLQEILQGQAVHHRAQHAHVVGSVALHTVLLQLRTTEEVAAAHHDRDLNTHLNDNADLLGKSCHNIGIDADLSATEDLTRELQHHALVRTIHPPVPFSVVELFASRRDLTMRRPPRTVRTAAP